MKFVTFQHNGHQHAGVLSGDSVVSLKAAGLPDMLSILQGGPEVFKRVEVELAKPPADSVFPLSAVKLCAPVPKPTEDYLRGPELSGPRDRVEDGDPHACRRFFRSTTTR